MIWGVVPWDAVPWGVVPWGVVPPLYILETSGALGVKIKLLENINNLLILSFFLVTSAFLLWLLSNIRDILNDIFEPFTGKSG